MKRTLLFSLIILLAIGSVIAEGSKESYSSSDENKVVVYAYDSFNGDWGPGPEVLPRFEQETGIEVEIISAGDGAEMLSRVVMEGDKCKADVVLGITDHMVEKAYSSELFLPYESSVLESIEKDLIFDDQYRLLPFDWGLFSFVIDTESGIEAPKTLWDLTKPEYKDKVILIDPRTSSVGLGLLMWTISEFGEDYLEWWSLMKENALVITDGWSSAYGLFTEGEAPIVLSYTTSPVYHVMNEDTTRYQAVLMPSHQATIEGIGILKSSKNLENAKKFVDFILTEAQADIAVLNSMYPVNSDTVLPDAYDYAPRPENMYTTDLEVAHDLDSYLTAWTEAMTR